MQNFNILSKKQKRKQTNPTNSPKHLSEDEALKKALDSEDPDEVQFIKQLEFALEQSKKDNSNKTPTKLYSGDQKCPDAPIKEKVSISYDSDEEYYKPTMILTNPPFQNPNQRLSLISPYEYQDQVVAQLEEKLSTNQKDQESLQHTITYLMRQMSQLQQEAQLIQEDLGKIRQ